MFGWNKREGPLASDKVANFHKFEQLCSSRVFHILMTDGIHDLNEILFRVNGVEQLLLYLRGYLKISLTNGGI